MERNKNLILIIVVSIVTLIGSCSRHTSEPNKEVAPPKGSIPVTVIDYSELDGCQFLLEMEDGTKLQPVNLDEKFMINGLKLFITFKYNDGMSVCMAGRMIQITSAVKAISP